MRIVVVVCLLNLKINYSSSFCDSGKLIKAKLHYQYNSIQENLCNGALKNDADVYSLKYLTCTCCVERKAFHNLQNIQSISLEDVCIRYVSPEFFLNTPKLERVSFKSNQIKLIQKFVFYASYLKFIDLSYNRIDTIERYAFADMVIISLNLGHNYLKTIDDSWFENSFIEKLSLANNKIIRLQNYVFANIRRLDELDLMFNKIHIIEDSIGLSTITKLELAGNALNNLKFLQNVRPSFLDISFNTISYLDPDDIVWVDELVMDPNPWHCSCLRTFWKDKHQIVVSSSPIAVDKWNELFPVCVTSKQDYQCEYKLDGDILEVQDRYFEIVDYIKMQNFV